MQKMKWSDEENCRITQSLDLLENVFNHESPLRRIWGLLDSLIISKHILNVNVLKKKNDKFRLLDLGCGTGELINTLSNFYKNGEFIGVDANLDSIKVAKGITQDRDNCRFVNCSFEESKHLGNFDIIVCSEVFEHVNDYNLLLEILTTQLNNNGFLSVSTPSGWMFRLPRKSTIGLIIRYPKSYFRQYLFPEKNWQEAIKIHPAIQPRKLIKLLKLKGLKLVSRQSSLWLINETSLCYRFLKFLEKSNKIKPSIHLYHYCHFLEALMNIVPLFRIFESRFILLLTKSQSVL